MIVDPKIVLEDVAKHKFDRIAVIGTIGGKYALWSSHEGFVDFIDDGIDALDRDDILDPSDVE